MLIPTTDGYVCIHHVARVRKSNGGSQIEMVDGSSAWSQHAPEHLYKLCLGMDRGMCEKLAELLEKLLKVLSERKGEGGKDDRA